MTVHGMTSADWAGLTWAKAMIALLLTAALLSTTGCAPTQQQLSDRANRIAEPSGLVPKVVATEQFHVMTYARIDDASQPLRVYLEGDGKAWITRTRISLNPTPHNPLALRLAALDKAPNVLYIARPCQYVSLTAEHQCTPHLWSQARYSPEVVEAIDEVISSYVSQTGTQVDQVTAGTGIELVGYSGGGALAVLVSIKREDVSSLRTVAANLDTELFTQIHQVSPLKYSLNPANFSDLTSALPQRHFVGSKDTVIPAAIAQSYRQQMAVANCVTIEPVSGATHSAGWEAEWPRLLNESMTCH